jgi:hypothetical protein
MKTTCYSVNQRGVWPDIKTHPVLSDPRAKRVMHGTTCLAIIRFPGPTRHSRISKARECSVHFPRTGDTVWNDPRGKPDAYVVLRDCHPTLGNRSEVADAIEGEHHSSYFVIMQPNGSIRVTWPDGNEIGLHWDGRRLTELAVGRSPAYPHTPVRPPLLIPA